MIIGTVRPEEARIFDQCEGYHRFHAEETQEEYGSFEVYWHDGKEEQPCACGDIHTDDCANRTAPGWYWWACSPGCLPDGEPSGPFASSRQAHQDADEWDPYYDE